jgi:hypothetical protein
MSVATALSEQSGRGVLRHGGAPTSLDRATGAAETMNSSVCHHLPARVVGAFSGIALLLSFAQPAAAQGGQGGGSGREPVGQCTPSREPHECADRCPSFDTCFIAGGDGQLYYQVDEQRFDCDGLVCEAAIGELGDYCCERGAFAPPSQDEGGGCSMSTRGRPPPALLGGSFALALAWVVTRRRGLAMTR